MATHTLDLLDNALDSLAEAIAKFEEGDSGEPKAYKFAVLHMAHFIELVFKHHIAQKHPLLIYREPFAQKLDKNKTIGLWDAINFINNEDDAAFPKRFREDLEWLKRLRNQIEHHKFTMDVAEARQTIGRLFRAVLEFLKLYSEVDVQTRIPAHTMATFKVLSDEYEFKLRDALKEASDIEEANPTDHHDPDARPARVNCDQCGALTLALTPKSPYGYRCTMCGCEDGDEIPAACSICAAECTRGELVHWDNEFGGLEGRCYYCSGQHHADRDD